MAINTEQLHSRKRPLAERGMSANVALAWSQGDFKQLTSFLGDAEPGELSASDPQLALYKAWQLTSAGQYRRSRQYLDAGLQAAQDSTDKEMACAFDLLLGFQHAPQPENTRARAERLIKKFPESSPWLPIVLLARANALAMQGHISQAEKAYYRSLAQSKVQDIDYLHFLSYHNLLEHLSLRGRLRSAETLCREMLRQELSGFLRPSFAMLANYRLGQILLEWNERADAKRHLMATAESASELGVSSLQANALSYLATLHHLDGSPEEAARQLDLAEEAISRRDPADALVNRHISRAYLGLLQGKLELAAHWIALAAIDETAPISTLNQASHRLTLARYLIESDHRDLPRARNLLTQVRDFAERSGSLSLSVHATLQIAAAQLAKGDPNRALELLEHALQMAAPENYHSAFITAGPAVQELLVNVRVDSPHSDYARRLLASKNELPGERAQTLSGRELEVLRCVAAGLSNASTAKQLYISTNTVKAHLKSVYGKLNVSNRAAAVDRAHQLSLL